MKSFLLFILLSLVMPLLAQDQGFESYIYQSNPLCEFRITVSTADTAGTLTYHLTFDGATASEGTLGADQSVEMVLPISQQWFVLVVERDAEDRGRYSVESGLDCDGDGASEGGSPPPVDIAALREKFEPLFAAIRAVLKK
jgi:hypothetical protein